MTLDYDVLIIGTGQAGPPLARRFAKEGLRVAIVERKLFGGTCVNTGCIPTKTLVASAYVAHMARRASEFGVVVAEPVRVDMGRVKARKDAISGRFRVGLERNLKELANCVVYEGHARFESAREVIVGPYRLRADRIFINVGGRAAVPDMPGLNTVPFLTNSSMMGVDVVPRHLVVVGGSYVGLEFAQMYRRFGSDVSVIEMGPRLIAHEDEDVSTAVAGFLRAEGIDVRLDAKCVSVRADGDQVTALMDCAEGAPSITGSHLLLAVGRRPNTDDLGLDAAGVSLDARGYIVVDEELRTSVEGIWALGDCNGRGAFTHTAYNDYEIVASNLLDGKPRRVTDRITTYALYTDPPLGRAGETETASRRSGRSVLVAKRPMTAVGRAVEKGETEGFMKIAVDRDTKEILGAAILGTGGDEVIHAILDVMYAKAPYTVLQNAVHIHPTVSELLPTLVGQLAPA